MLVTINLAPKGSVPTKVREPLVEKPKRRNEMPDAVKVAVVRAGAFYICSEEVLKVLGPRVQYMEFAEDYSSREREERTTYGGKHTKKVRGEALNRFGAMLEKATDDEILGFLKKGYLEIPRMKWSSENVRRAAVKALVAALGKNARDMTKDDFVENGLCGLVSYHYRSSPYDALKDAGFDIKPWEMGMAPIGFWKERENRVEAIRWLVEKLGRDARKITANDFGACGLWGVLNYYGYSPYDALKDAGFDMKPWEMEMAPIGFWKERENRVEAIRWLVAKLGKDPKKVIGNDFEANGLAGLLIGNYGDSPYDALTDAGFDMKPWDRDMAPIGFWKERENRVDAIKRLVTKTGKVARDITATDFGACGLWGVLNYYNNSPYDALLDAGLITEADEEHMRSSQHMREGKNRELETGN